MQIGFFACNENAVQEYVYADFALQQLMQKEAEFFIIGKDQFSLYEDIRINFKWNGSTLIFQEVPENSYQLLCGMQRVEGKCICSSIVLTLISLQRERLFLCLFFAEMWIGLFKTGHQEISVGKNPENTICKSDGKEKSEGESKNGCIDELLSGRHLRIKRNEHQTEVLVEGRNGIYVNQKYVGRYERRELCFGDEIWVFGLKLVWLGEVMAVCTQENEEEKSITVRLQIYESGNMQKKAEKTRQLQHVQTFSPAPRNRQPLDQEPVELEAPPQKREAEKQPLFLTIGPAFTMALPMLLGFGAAIWAASNSGTGGHQNGMFMYTGLITAVASALLGSFWAFMNVRQRSRSLQHAEQKREAAYRSYMLEFEHKIKEKYRYNRNILLSTYPVVSEYLSSEGNPLLLWNRLETDEDFLTYRLGIGNLDFEVPIIIPKERFSVEEDALKDFPVLLKQHYQELKEVPICIDLLKERLHGVIGGSSVYMAELIRVLALQIGVTNSAKQVRMAFLFSSEKWLLKWLTMLRWLPHVWTEEEHLIALDSGRVREVAYLLEQYLVREDCSIQHLIIFCDSYELLGKVLQKDERVSILLFANDYGELVSDCRSIILKTKDFTGRLGIGGERTFRREILFDSIGLSETVAYARRLCGLHLTTADINSAIPQKVTIFDLFGIKKVSSTAICENWQKSRSESSLSVEIGMAEGGRICCLDPHEKGHGPHGLIAGMTGSGKSEMLQTIVLSLSLKYSPQEAGFFLIDYKGGGMANLFSGLPHLLGSISNLSGSMIYRAMVSIRSENERRQRLFLSASVNQIHDYQKLFRSGRVTEALPHIFIIIDEFAELKREEPDFMRELISVAQVGRSLGIHLILATQKPAGTVDDNIWSNARFRICLRVQDRQDSNDMLHRSDAAYITNPGRAILQVGNDELFQMFQGAYTMEPYEETCRETEAAVLLDEYGRKSSLYRPPQTKALETQFEEAESKKELQIDRLLVGIQQAAAYMGCGKRRALWLPPLPVNLYYAELLQEQMQKGDENRKDNNRENNNREDDGIFVGRYDYPQKQKQGTFTISLREGGHHIICGMAACGKSTFLQTILYALLEKETPKTLHIYMIDYSSRLLACFEESALSGGVITEEEQKNLPKLFFMLEELLQERKKLLKGGSFLQYQNRNKQDLSEKENLPAILLVIDNYGSFREKTGGRFDSIIQELSKAGENYGIYLLLTASGIGSSELPNRLFENCRTGICLTMNDKYQYCEVLRTSMLKLRLPENVKGRGMAWIDGEILEFQCALCLKSENDFERMEKLKRRIRQRNLDFAGQRARQVPSIPDKPVVSEFLGNLSAEEYIKHHQLPIGYEEQSGKIFALSLQTVRHVFITGKARTGKQNCLKVMKQAAESCKFSYVEIESVEQLAACIRTGGDLSIVLYFIPNLSTALNEFYVNHYKKETEQFLCQTFEMNSLHKVITIVENSQLPVLSGRKLFEVLKQEAYGIHMGGALDSQSLFDFSDIPFSRQGAVKKAGCGTIPKSESADFSIDVMIPLVDGVQIQDGAQI